jgi:hypothetical protein
MSIPLKHGRPKQKKIVREEKGNKLMQKVLAYSFNKAYSRKLSIN